LLRVAWGGGGASELTCCCFCTSSAVLVCPTACSDVTACTTDSVAGVEPRLAGVELVLAGWPAACTSDDGRHASVVLLRRRAAPHELSRESCPNVSARR